MVKGSTVGRSFIRVGDRAVVVSLGRAVRIGGGARRIGGRPHKKPIATVGDTEGIFVRRTQDRIRRIGRESHAPVRTRRDRSHVRHLHRSDQQGRGISAGSRLSRIQDRENIEWIINRNYRSSTRLRIAAQAHIMGKVSDLRSWNTADFRRRRNRFVRRRWQ